MSLMEARYLVDSLQESLFPTLHHYSSMFDVDMPIWDIMKDLPTLIDTLAEMKGYTIHPDAVIHPMAIVSNSFIGKQVQIYEGCTIRDSIVLDNTVIGHGSEVARSIILAKGFIPRFNYVGGSFLGEHVQLGGGVMLAARRHDDKPIVIQWGKERIRTYQWKFGSIIGNDVVISFSAHVNPGSVIGSGTLVMPMVEVRGYIPQNSMVYVKQQLTVMQRRPFPNVDELPE